MRLISWNITKECDLYCRHCYRDAGEKAGNELTSKEAKDLLREIKKAGFELVIFSGGEPLLRKDVFELISHADRLGLISCLGTNGILLNLETAKKLKDLKLSSAGISLDSITSDYHDALRKSKGSWQKAISAAKNCRSAGLTFQIHTTVTKENYLGIPHLIKLSIELGAKAHYFFFLVPCGRARGMDKEALSSAEHEQALRLILEARKKVQIYLRPVCAPQFVRFVHNTPHPSPLPRGERGEEKENGCLAGREYCLISPEGDIYPCPYLALKVGNVRKQKFSQIWQDSAVFNNLRDLTKYKGRCGDCEYIEDCSGCRARAYEAASDYLEEDPACAYQPLSVRS